VSVESHNTSLVRLGDISKDNIDHADEHTVLVWVTSILDDGDDVTAFLGHFDEITTGAGAELDCIDKTFFADDVADVRHCSSRGSAQIEHVRAGSDVDIFDTAEDGGGDLTSEGIPLSVLDLVARRANVDGDTLLLVYAHARHHVARDQHVFLSSGEENALVTMFLDNDL